MRRDQCPACGELRVEGAQFCTACGTRLDQPNVLELDATAPPADEAPEKPGLLIAFLELFPGLVSPQVVLMSLLAAAIAVPLNWLGVMILMMGAAFAGIAIMSFGLICYWTACVWMLLGYLCLPSEGLAEFNSTQWFLGTVLGMAPIIVSLTYIGMH